MSPEYGSPSIPRRASTMRSRSLSGSLARLFVAGSATMSSQLFLKLTKGDVVAAFDGGSASTDRRRFSLRGSIGRIASLVMHGANCDLALCNLKFDQIAT